MKHLNSNTEEALNNQEIKIFEIPTKGEGNCYIFKTGKTELYNISIPNTYPELFGEKDTVSFSAVIDEERQELTLIIEGEGGKIGIVKPFKSLKSLTKSST